MSVMCNVVNTCFICLMGDVNLTKLLDTHCDKLRFCFGSVVYDSNHCLICGSCERQLQKSFEFKKMFDTNQCHLKKYINSQSANDSKIALEERSQNSNLSDENVVSKTLEVEQPVHYIIKEELCIQENFEFVDVAVNERDFSEHTARLKEEPDFVKVADGGIKEGDKSASGVLGVEVISSEMSDSETTYGMEKKMGGDIVTDMDVGREVKENTEETDVKDYTCYTCRKNFRCSIDLERHVTLHFVPTVKNVMSGNCVIKEEVNIKEETDEFQDDDDDGIKVLPKKKSNGGEQNSCEECHKKFFDKNSLKSHMVIHTGAKPFSCKECGKHFGYRTTLRNHMVIHTAAKPYSCKECHKEFSRKYTLKDHMAVHTGAKPYDCKECQKKFSRPSKLKQHMNVHTGAKPYSCDECHTSFSDKSSLRNHVVIHTDAKPYSCKLCDKKFGQRATLTNHMTVHTGAKPYSCKECCKEYSDRSSLKRHMFVHTGEKPYSCKECHKQFVQKSHLNTHMAIHSTTKT